MGLEQYIRAGASLKRSTVTLSTSPSGSGSVDLGSAYALLNISTNNPCRLRLYDNSQSLSNGGEIVRKFGNINISASVALIADISMSSADTYGIDPVVYGIVQTPANKLTYYRVENTQSGAYPTITFTRYNLEDPAISTANRITTPNITGSLLPNQIVSGTLLNVPRTYLLVSASVSGALTQARLRLYSTKDSFSNMTEISRSFATESSNTSKLIVDALLSGSETTYFIPKIVGANLQTMGNNLNVVYGNDANIMGYSEMYYVLQNVSSSGGAVNITASLHVFALED